MDEEEKERARERGAGEDTGAIFVVGIGPGSHDQITPRALKAIESADIVAGYTRYVALLGTLVEDKEILVTGMTAEVERCTRAVEAARAGRRVAVVCSGDAGVYGMAGLVLQIASKLGVAGDIDIEVIPGLPAFVAAAALLGAPLMHDFASVSLSDLLTPRGLIERRVEAAASADFVIVLYNPKSSKRVEGLGRAIDIIRGHRDAKTPVGIVRNASREHESVAVATLGSVHEHYGGVDMLSIVIVGNSSTIFQDDSMITPRGYRDV